MLSDIDNCDKIFLSQDAPTSPDDNCDSTRPCDSTNGYSIYDTLDEFSFISYMSDDDFDILSMGSGKIDKQIYSDWNFLDYGLKDKIEDNAVTEDAADEDAADDDAAESEDKKYLNI